ncbi:MAG: tRNA (adenosine(37)-N6)-dimethylallyltransferase MiaA [Candidatus Cloacimonetes bacterium]|nr:tRNA (adenosine(37)-N6)-dimethylallyltransferase MiaA [Candidatus Cloacimonadota bacterium]
MADNRIIIIQGATGTGKSALAEKLAVEFNGEIISADSRQVYRYLDIGTAKPDAASRAQVNYHLIDIINPDERYNAGRFCEDAQAIVQDIFNRGKVPFIVGGTGFYIAAFLKGLADIPAISKEAKAKVATMLKDWDADKIYRYLCQVDKQAAAKIEQNDLHRMQRALEVFESSGKPISWWWSKPEQKNTFTAKNILLMRNREILYKRINDRMDRMLEKGLISEIRQLFAKGYGEGDPGMITVGYREFYPWLRNEITLDESVNLAKQHSRNYAKRQLTWYRKQYFDLTFTIEYLNLSTLKEEIAAFLGEGDEVGSNRKWD